MCDSSKGCRTACCYYEGSPCEHLRIIDHQENRGVCRIYAERFGEHQTVAGERFQCVPYGEYLKHQPAHAKCGYSVIHSIEGIPVIRGQV